MQNYGTYLVMIPLKDGSEPIPALVEYDWMNFLGDYKLAVYNPVFEGTYPEVESYKDAEITYKWFEKYTNLTLMEMLELAAQEIEPLIEKE